MPPAADSNTTRRHAKPPPRKGLSCRGSLPLPPAAGLMPVKRKKTILWAIGRCREALDRRECRPYGHQLFEGASHLTVTAWACPPQEEAWAIAHAHKRRSAQILLSTPPAEALQPLCRGAGTVPKCPNLDTEACHRSISLIVAAHAVQYCVVYQRGVRCFVVLTCGILVYSAQGVRKLPGYAR